MILGITLAVLSGLCNGLFSAPMKLEAKWKWENIWVVFILIACWLMPVTMVAGSGVHISEILSHSPQSALTAALLFGFLWGFGAICFGRSVERLGVSVANTLVIGLSSALGSLVPLVLSANFHIGSKELLLLAGIATFLLGVFLSGRGGALRDSSAEVQDGSSVITKSGSKLLSGYLFAVCSGVMSAIFNIGYSLALPISDSGVALGYSRFSSTNCIWLLMLGMGAVPNLVYCVFLMRKHRTFPLLLGSGTGKSWALSSAMGLLWGGSIFLYGAATPLLGDLGPSVGWPLSLAVGLVVANLMGVMLGEWRRASPQSVLSMRTGFALLLLAIMFCAYSARMSA